MHVNTFSDHKTVNLWWHLWILYGTKNGLYGIWISGHTRYKILWTYSTGFLENLKGPFPFPVAWRATYGVSSLVLTTIQNCKQCKYDVLMQWNTHQFIRNDMHTKTMCYLQHIFKKINFHNGIKSVATLSNTPCCIVFLSIARNTSIHYNRYVEFLFLGHKIIHLVDGTDLFKIGNLV